MALTPVKYQNLTYRSTQSDAYCGYCPMPVYLNKTEALNIQIGLMPYNDVDIFTTYGDPPVLVNLTESPTGTYCYDRTPNTPYKATYTIDIAEGNPGDGGMANEQYTQITFNYTSNVLFYCTIELQDSTGTVITTQTFELPAAFSGIDVTKYFLCTVDDPAGYKIVITLYSSTVSDTASFCFSDLKGLVMSIPGGIYFVDCNGNTDLAPYLLTQGFYSDMLLAGIDMSELSTEGYLRITCAYDNNNCLYSSLFIPIDADTYPLCKSGKLIRIDWREACNLENEATSYTSIDYHVYVQGYTERLPLVNDERVMITEPGGRKRMVFNYSYAPEQIKVGLYGKDVHEIVERAVESEYVAIDGNEYQLDDGSVYALAPIGNGRYTGRVDMIKVGTERVLSSCCCPVPAVEVGCGELVITDICQSAGGPTGYRIEYDLVGVVTGTSIDVQFENVTEASDGVGCTTVAGTTTNLLNQGSVAGAIQISNSDWNDVFDDNYCGDTGILYYMRIRVNCGATQGEWSAEFPFVPNNIDNCESSG